MIELIVCLKLTTVMCLKPQRMESMQQCERIAREVHLGAIASNMKVTKLQCIKTLRL